MRIDDIIKNIDYFIRNYMIDEVCLSGGEPTILKSFIPTLREIQKIKLKIYLHTNAMKFSNILFANECLHLVSKALVPLHFYDSKTCDYFSGITNTFEKRITGIKNLLDSSVHIRTNTVILDSNYNLLPKISKLIQKLGIKYSLFTFPFFFAPNKEQFYKYVPNDFSRLKKFLGDAIDNLIKSGVNVSIQGIPPCLLGEFQTFREIDHERAFVDSENQLDRFKLLFSSILGFYKNSKCNSCEMKSECWGFPNGYHNLPLFK